MKDMKFGMCKNQNLHFGIQMGLGEKCMSQLQRNQMGLRSELYIVPEL
jgi:hypothetical protein